MQQPSLYIYWGVVYQCQRQELTSTVIQVTNTTLELSIYHQITFLSPQAGEFMVYTVMAWRY